MEQQVESDGAAGGVRWSSRWSQVEQQVESGGAAGGVRWSSRWSQVEQKVESGGAAGEVRWGSRWSQVEQQVESGGAAGGFRWSSRWSQVEQKVESGRAAGAVRWSQVEQQVESGGAADSSSILPCPVSISTKNKTNFLFANLKDRDFLLQRISDFLQRTPDSSGGETSPLIGPLGSSSESILRGRHYHPDLPTANQGPEALPDRGPEDLGPKAMKERMKEEAWNILLIFSEFVEESACTGPPEPESWS
ncbi:TBC1 domain family member 9 [Dissostichus eleginoides]|uniref:TBC1 domain family member 9 n=1 Tax=Dissostichus eleginoides TaxID=100907 RepID=A0AAD9CP34_DISEL|nr:TBC1 domain family member 9 [Dissostichus eleginoides]